jgi:DHA1 family tetracycline resistance protein-like MFS transporter
MFTEPESSIYVLSPDTAQQVQYILLGLLFAVYTFGQFFANPIFGQLSDKYGRRLILGLAILGTAISNFVFAFGALVASLGILFGARLFDGITGGSIAIAQAIAADISEPEDRAKNFGLVGASLGFGFMFGPLLGGVLSDPSILPFFGAPFVFVISGLLSLLNVVFIYLFLPETSPMDTTIEIRPARSIRNIGRAFSNSATRGIYSLSFVYSFGFTLFTSFLGVYLVSRLGYNQSQIGFFFFYVGFLIIPFQVLLVPFVDRYVRRTTLLYVAFATLAVTLLLIALSTNTWQVLLIIVFFAAANAVGRTTVTAVVSAKASKESQGSALGIDASVQSLGQALPAILAGLIAARFGVTAPLVLGFVVFGFGVLLVFIYRKRLV